jgi:hypothetical protein
MVGLKKESTSRVMNLPSSSMNHPKPHPPMKAMNVRLFGARNESAKTIAIAIISAPQIACEMCSVPLPS